MQGRQQTCCTVCNLITAPEVVCRAPQIITEAINRRWVLISCMPLVKLRLCGSCSSVTPTAIGGQF